MRRVVTHHGYDSDGEGDDGAAAGGGSGDEAAGDAAAGSSGAAGRTEAAGARSPAQMDPETVFMQVCIECCIYVVSGAHSSCAVNVGAHAWMVLRCCTEVLALHPWNH